MIRWILRRDSSWLWPHEWNEKERREQKGGGEGEEGVDDTGSTFVCISSHNRKRPVASPSQWLRFCFPPPACFPGGGGGGGKRSGESDTRKLLVSKPNKVVHARTHRHTHARTHTGQLWRAWLVLRQTLIPLSGSRQEDTGLRKKE